MNALQYKSERAIVKAQNIDITNFEDDLESFKSSFGKKLRPRLTPLSHGD